MQIRHASNRLTTLAIVAIVALSTISPTGSPPASAATTTASPPGPTAYVACGTRSGDNGAVGTGTRSDPWTTLAAASAGLTAATGGLTFLGGSGTTCTGTLDLGVSGTAAAPFVVTTEDPAHPVTLNGGGAVAALVIRDQSHVTVRGLAFENVLADGSVPPAWGWYGVGAIRIRAEHRPVTGVHLERIRVSAVNCSRAGVCAPKRAEDPVDETGLAAVLAVASGDRSATLNDVTVTGSTFDHVGLYGFRALTVWNARDRPTQTTPVTGVRVTGNHFRDLPGGAAVFSGTKGAVFSGNTVERFSRNAQYTSAGVYPYYSDGTVISGNTFSGGGGGLVSSCPAGSDGGSCQLDGQAVDIDNGTNGTVVEDNVSHDNDRGFLMLCGGAPRTGTRATDLTQNAVIRRNTSTDDGGFGIRLTCAGAVKNVVVSNNTWTFTRTQKAPVHLVSNTNADPGTPGQQPANWGNELTLTGNTITNRSATVLTTSVYAVDPAHSAYRSSSNRLSRPVTEPARATRSDTGWTMTPVPLFAPALRITSPVAKATLKAPSTPRFTGTGQPGATVQVVGTRAALTGKVTVGSNGTWSATATRKLARGDYLLTAVQSSGSARPTVLIRVR